MNAWFYHVRSISLAMTNEPQRETETASRSEEQTNNSERSILFAGREDARNDRSRAHTINKALLGNVKIRYLLLAVIYFN